MGSQHEKHHQPQQQQYQRSTDTGGNELHIKIGYGIILAFRLHALSSYHFIILPPHILFLLLPEYINHRAASLLARQRAEPRQRTTEYPPEERHRMSHILFA